jgi:2-oxoglutarate ferredoxin oxidoreductase subunit beta
MPEDAFDPCKLAIGAGASFAARSSVSHPVHLTKTLAEAIAWKGFSFVEVLQHCHVLWGRRNGMPEAMDMLNFYRQNSAFNSESVSEEERFGSPIYDPDGDQEIKFILGVLHREPRPELTEELAKMRARVMAAKQAGKE